MSGSVRCPKCGSPLWGERNVCVTLGCVVETARRMIDPANPDGPLIPFAVPVPDAPEDEMRTCNCFAVESDPTCNGHLPTCNMHWPSGHSGALPATDTPAETRDDSAHRQWALANVRRAVNDIPPCEHAPGYMEYATCVVCAHELGRRTGHVEAGAYLTHEEAVANIRAALSVSVQGEP